MSSGRYIEWVVAGAAGLVLILAVYWGGTSGTRSENDCHTWWNSCETSERVH